MGVRVSSGFCRTCKRQVMAQGNQPNHLLHLILAIVTAGLWLPIWLLVTLSAGRPRCTNCGSKVA